MNRLILIKYHEITVIITDDQRLKKKTDYFI